MECRREDLAFLEVYEYDNFCFCSPPSLSEDCSEMPENIEGVRVVLSLGGSVDNPEDECVLGVLRLFLSEQFEDHLLTTKVDSITFEGEYTCHSRFDDSLTLPPFHIC